MRNLILVFTAKFFLLLGVAFLATKFIPYLGSFPYSFELDQYHLPKFIASLANFDGIHYLKIAKKGYETYVQAFFPLYPILIRSFSFVFLGNHFLTGLFISNISFFVGFFFFYKILKTTGQKSLLFWTLVFLLTFPSAFFFNAVYTEGLFFMFFVLTLFFIKQRQYLTAGFFAAAASATRLIGVFLFIPFLLSLYPVIKKKKKIKLIYTLFPFIGLFIYLLYLWQTVGDPLAFFNSQPAFGASRSTKIVFLPQVYFRYLKIFFLSQFNFSYFIALVEFFIFNIVFIACFLDFVKNVKEKNYHLLSMAIFSLINILLPPLTGTFSSIPRYALLSISTFFFLARIQNIAFKASIALFFGLLQIVLFAFFMQGYFVS